MGCTLHAPAADWLGLNPGGWLARQRKDCVNTTEWSVITELSWLREAHRDALGICCIGVIYQQYNYILMVGSQFLRYAFKEQVILLVSSLNEFGLTMARWGIDEHTCCSHSYTHCMCHLQTVQLYWRSFFCIWSLHFLALKASLTRFLLQNRIEVWNVRLYWKHHNSSCQWMRR